MNYYALRTNDHNTVVNTLTSNQGTIISFDNLSWYLNDISNDDICFIKISGDEAVKRTSYDNSLIAIAKVVRTPYHVHIPQGKSTDHFTIDIEVIDTFNSVTADLLYKYPSLKNTMSIGGSTKGMPNQAIGRITNTQGQDIIKALVNEGILNRNVLSSYNITNTSLEVLTPSIITI